MLINKKETSVKLKIKKILTLIIPILYNKIKITSSVKTNEIFINGKLLYITATETEETAPAKKYNATV